MPQVRIPLFGSLTNRNSNPSAFTAKDQRFTNCYPEIVKNQITGKSTVYLYKRLGTVHTATAGGFYKGITGCCSWTGSATYGVAGTPLLPFTNVTNLRIYTTGATQIGSDITGLNCSAALLSETQISGTSNIVVIANKSSDTLDHAWYFPEGGSWTEITSGNFPPNQSPTLSLAGDFAHLDGYAFVMDAKGNIWNSDLNSLANWTATSYVNSNAYPDGGIGVARYGNYIVAFGAKSIEFYKNSGNPTGSPLARIGEGVKTLGCAGGGSGQRTYLNVGDDLYFIGINSGGFGVYKINGFGEPTKVSNPAIDKMFTENAALNIAGSFSMHGMTHILFWNILPQICYCVETGTWWYMSASSGQTRFVGCVAVSGASYFTSDIATGKGFYTASPGSPVFQDDGSAFTATVQTSLLDFGTANRKFFKSLKLIGDIQSTSGNTGVSWSDDDYATFSSAVNLDMSVANGQIVLLGKSRRRAFKITDAVNRPLRLEAMELIYDVGSS